jgi:hypothetical protein
MVGDLVITRLSHATNLSMLGPFRTEHQSEIASGFDDICFDRLHYFCDDHCKQTSLITLDAQVFSNTTNA